MLISIGGNTRKAMKTLGLEVYPFSPKDLSSAWKIALIRNHPDKCDQSNELEVKAATAMVIKINNAKDALEHLAIDPEESIEAAMEKARAVKNRGLFDMTEECHHCNGSGVQIIKLKEHYVDCHSCDKSMDFSFWGSEGRPLGVKTVKCNRCENGEFTLRSGRKVECNRCKGTARVKIKCPTCKGRGVVVVPAETISRPCDECGGEGRVKIEVFNPVIAEAGVLV